MMAAINQSNFDGHVGQLAYLPQRSREPGFDSCHPAIPDPKPSMREAASPANLSTADQLLDKYVSGSGGEKAISAVSSRVIEGTASFLSRLALGSS